MSAEHHPFVNLSWGERETETERQTEREGGREKLLSELPLKTYQYGLGMLLSCNPPVAVIKEIITVTDPLGNTQVVDDEAKPN